MIIYDNLSWKVAAPYAIKQKSGSTYVWLVVFVLDPLAYMLINFDCHHRVCVPVKWRESVPLLIPQPLSQIVDVHMCEL